MINVGDRVRINQQWNGDRMWLGYGGTVVGLYYIRNTDYPVLIKTSTGTELPCRECELEVIVPCIDAPAACCR